MRLPRSLLLCFFGLSALAPVAAQQAAAPPATPAPTPAAVESPAAGTPAASQPFVVYLADEESTAPGPATPRVKVGDPSPATLAVVAAIFLLAAWARLRFRAPQCPRCRSNIAHLERSPDDTSLLAASGHTVSGTAPGALVCLACDEVVRPRFLSLMTTDTRCPQCRQPTKKSQLHTLERSGYLTWGVVRLDQECLSCTYRSAEIYPAPPLEAPVAAKKGLSGV
jgi:hypothetical protein